MKIKINIFFLAALFLFACLDEIVSPPLTGELNDTAKMLMVFEENGDFINSHLAPPLITAQELYNNKDQYLILDTRNHNLFIQGHIENSISISNRDLYNFINNLIDTIHANIVIVSKNGQSSSYYSALLRLAGFDNVYSLKYGMASWHVDFAGEWLSAVGDDPVEITFTNYDFPKNDFMDFPPLEESDSNLTIPGIITSRIQRIISNGFSLNDAYVNSLPAASETNYIICYGNSSLYFGPKLDGDIFHGHPVSAVSYRDAPQYEFKTSKFLQTVPNDRTIIVYSYNGQLSACIAAYLNVIGYKAKSLLFGTNSLFYSRMLAGVDLNEYAFTDAEIMNFDYITGE